MLATRFYFKKKFSLLLIFLILTAFLLVFLKSMGKFLSETRKVNASLLVVEGWIPVSAFKAVYDEYLTGQYNKIVTTGLNTPEYCQLSSNGNLVFYLHNGMFSNVNSLQHKIEISAYSELDGEHSAHFTVFVNDKQVGDFFAQIKEKQYTVEWKGLLTDIDSVTIRFDNDMLGEFGDRNLYVNKIIFDSQIEIPVNHNSVYKIDFIHGNQVIPNNYGTYAESARLRLIELGIDSSKIEAVSAGKVELNRTLASVYAFKSWLSDSEHEYTGINIISYGIHARRTFMIFKQILPTKYRIGIIAIPDEKLTKSRKYKYFKVIRELAGIAYYRVLLL